MSDKSTYDAASRRLVAETLENLERMASLTCSEENYNRLRDARLALYIHVATGGQIAVEDVTSDMLVSWDEIVAHAKDAESHARGYRALCEQVVIDHPTMLPHLYAVAFGHDIFAVIETQALGWYLTDRNATPEVARPTHASNETRH